MTGGRGLGAIRAGLEHRPRGSITPRGPSAALDALRFRWGDLYYLEVTGGWYTATRRQPPRRTLRAANPDELNSQLTRDWGSW